MYASPLLTAPLIDLLCRCCKKAEGGEALLVCTPLVDSLGRFCSKGERAPVPSDKVAASANKESRFCKGGRADEVAGSAGPCPLKLNLQLLGPTASPASDA